MLPDEICRLRSDGPLSIWPCQMFYVDLEDMKITYVSVKCRFI